MTSLEQALLAGLLVLAALFVGNKIVDATKDAAAKIEAPSSQSDQSSP